MCLGGEKGSYGGAAVCSGVWGDKWGPQRQRPQPRYEPLLNAEDPRLQMLAQDKLYETRQWDDKVQPEGEHGPKSFPLPQTAVQLCHRNAVCLAAESALRISSATEMVRRGSVQTKSTGAWMWTFSPLGESLRRSSGVGCCLVLKVCWGSPERGREKFLL